MAGCPLPTIVYPELQTGNGTFYGEHAGELANRLGIQPDDQGRFTIPSDRIAGVYIATYQRSAPLTVLMQTLNRPFSFRGGDQ
jgi:hypothetical protein